MNKKYYVFTMLLSGIGILSSYLHTVPASYGKAQQETTNILPSDGKEDQLTYPHIGQIRFSGNTVISSEELQRAIPLKINLIADEHIIMDSMVKIAQLYKAKEIKVTITPVLEKVATNTTKIQFEIHEKIINEK